MHNTDFFSFEFVDRGKERELLNAFTNFTVTENYPSVLWITGNHGVGKTYLLTHICNYLEGEGRYIIYTTANREEEYGHGDYIKGLLREIEKKSDVRVVTFLRNHYKQIIKLGMQAAKTVLDIKGIDNHNVIDILSEVACLFITQDEKEDTYSEVITKYILSAIAGYGKAIFVLDNFTLSDDFSAEKICQIIHAFASASNIRFIICTTDEDLSTRDDIREILSVRLSTRRLRVEEFEDDLLFVKMVEKNLDLDKQTLALIKESFRICEGYPQRFKAFLINLYVEGGLITDFAYKARIKKDIFEKLLAKECTNIDIDALSYSQKYVLKQIYLWNREIPYSLLAEFISYTFTISPYNSFTAEILNETVQSLITLKLLEESNEILPSLKLSHDTLFYSCKTHFSGEISNRFDHYNIYSFIKTNENFNKYCEKSKIHLLAYHAYMAETDDWVDINIEYAKSLFYQNNYVKAGTISKRLLNKLDLLSSDNTFLLAQIEFSNGHYKNAIEILDKYEEQLKDDIKTKVQYYILRANVYMCLLKPQDALNTINKALEIKRLTTKERIQVCCRKQSILFVFPDGFKDAKAEFDRLIKYYAKTTYSEMIQVYASSMDYYEGQYAIDLLGAGIQIAKMNNDKKSEGKLLNNIAFEEFRLGNYMDSYRDYNKCIELIKSIQPHEQAYPLNNLAVICMINNEWDRALDYIIEAIFWNSSYYVKTVLKVNRMLCHYFLKQEQWKYIYKELELYTNEAGNIDNKIYKKIYINLAYISLKEGNRDEALRLLELYKPYSSSEWEQGLLRFQKLYAEANGENIYIKPKDFELIGYYYDIKFEPWLVNFTHD